MLFYLAGILDRGICITSGVRIEGVHCVHESNLHTHFNWKRKEYKKNASSSLYDIGNNRKESKSERNLHGDESLFLDKAASLNHRPVMTDGGQSFMPEVVV